MNSSSMGGIFNNSSGGPVFRNPAVVFFETHLSALVSPRLARRNRSEKKILDKVPSFSPRLGRRRDAGSSVPVKCNHFFDHAASQNNWSAGPPLPVCPDLCRTSWSSVMVRDAGDEDRDDWFYKKEEEKGTNKRERKLIKHKRRK